MFNACPLQMAVTETKHGCLVMQMTNIEQNQDKDCSVMFSSEPSVDIMHYLSTGSLSGVAFPCPAGAFSAQMGLSNVSGCELCPPGRYCSSPGLVAPTGVCSPG